MDTQSVLSPHQGILPSLKEKELLAHVTIWMNPEDILLSELSQSQKDQRYMIPFT